MDNPLVNESDIICKCFQVSEGTIRACIGKNDLTSIEEVTQACEAGGGCHSCHILIQLFLDQHQHKQSNVEALMSQYGGKIKKRGILSRFFKRSKSSVPAS
ncbi:MAG: hypothetical protein COV67_15670 [Nitrospinae bacterium CG11_big_fil_rev_8_21_14_0_20_56_8]|nr:MAG: hypothetical protein COV67_15670 [Nitrospinae bacterium CG11_big_fil_rev_8_21_14_0_20_56_8]